MRPLGFDWDDLKAAANLRRHGVSFLEASTVFEDRSALFMADPAHSDDEERFLILGVSVRLRVLLIAHCHRGDENVIRIISARRASARQCEAYERRKR